METTSAPEAAVAASPSSRPELGPDQRQAILAAAGELICATVEVRGASFPDPTLAGAARLPVCGAFVSLKRNGHLRSCCGGLQRRAASLGQAVYEATLRTVQEDVRFPPVSRTELPYLEMEVWLLFNPQPVTARGEARVDAVVTGGKHGLVIERGAERGLLLPGVAAEHGWDSRRFLEQTCVKAGLHPSLWKDDATAVLTFEGESIRGPVVHTPPARSARPPAPLGEEELRAYVDFARRNIYALLAGATPSFYAAGLPDGTVSGVALGLRRGGNGRTVNVHQLSLRPGVPLQATLFGLAQLAAQVLVREGMQASELPALELGLTVLHDPAMHGTAEDPQLEGLEPPHRAVLVVERGKSAIAFDRRCDAADLAATAARLAHVNTPAHAALFSLEAQTTEAEVAIANVPRPEPGPLVRPAGVAGRFYPADAAELTKLIDGLLPADARPESWPAAMVPHAGLRFSGHIAGAVFSRLRIPSTVIILGPKHTALGMEWAVAPHRTWALPGCTIESDPDLARRLAEAIPGLALDAQAHQQEHAIEVELPFLARLAPRAKVVGIAVGHGDLNSCRRFADGLARVIRDCETPPLLLISSDMNHFATDAENRRLDELALAALDRLDPEDVYTTVAANQISMCGVLPAVIVLETLRRLGRLHKSERVGYATSADVTGDTGRVVGYAGMLFG